MTVHVTASVAGLADGLGLKASRVRKLLSDLQKEELVIAEGPPQNRIYKLKA